MAGATLEERIAGLEGSYRELTKRIDDLREETHRGLDALRPEMTNERANLPGEFVNLRGEFANLRNESRVHFRWIVSFLLVNWLSTLAWVFLIAARN